MRRAIVTVAALALLGACGSDSAPAQPEDEFLDRVEASCRTAQREADKLDLGAEGTAGIEGYLDIVATVHEEIEDLEPPSSLKKDFDNFVGNLDDQLSVGRGVVSAIDSGDTTAVNDEVAALLELTGDTDTAAKALGALRCRAIADVSVIGLGSSADTTVPEQTIPVDTTPEDTTETTVPTDTVDTSTDDTSPEPIFPNNLNEKAVAPPGFSWVTDFVQSDAARLYAKPDIGPIITDYSVGQIVHDAEGYTAGIYVMTIDGEFTGDILDQYLTWEVLDGGTDETTPSGLPVIVRREAFEDTDCIGYITGNRGLSVCTASSIDGKPVLDAYVAANPG